MGRFTFRFPMRSIAGGGGAGSSAAQSSDVSSGSELSVGSGAIGSTECPSGFASVVSFAIRSRKLTLGFASIDNPDCCWQFSVPGDGSEMSSVAIGCSGVSPGRALALDGPHPLGRGTTIRGFAAWWGSSDAFVGECGRAVPPANA
jgi:hypothetical protein